VHSNYCQGVARCVKAKAICGSGFELI